MRWGNIPDCGCSKEVGSCSCGLCHSSVTSPRTARSIRIRSAASSVRSIGGPASTECRGVNVESHKPTLGSGNGKGGLGGGVQTFSKNSLSLLYRLAVDHCSRPVGSLSSSLQGLSISLPYSCHSYSMKITSSWSYRVIVEFGLTQSENAIILIGNFRKSGLITSYCKSGFPPKLQCR